VDASTGKESRKSASSSVRPMAPSGSDSRNGDRRRWRGDEGVSEVADTLRREHRTVE
jgi:hypothetical protein